MKFKDRVVVVTGGGSGIGRSIAEHFAADGAVVCILDVMADAAKEVVHVIESKHGVASFYLCNVADQSSVTGVINAILDKYSCIDILVNNAGVAHIGNAETTSEQDFDRIFSINVKGVYNCLHAVIPSMKVKGGVILNIASVAAIVGIAERFAYSASKGAVAAMTRSVAKDFIHHHIRCNSISPGRVHTPFVDGFLKNNYPGREAEMFEKLAKTQPIGRMAEPDEIAKLALFLCSDDAAFITGTDYPIDGGFVTLNS
jgi:2-keto-3-deoxy-L-fuconate dehydrogenase